MLRTRLQYGTAPLPWALSGWAESILGLRMRVLFFPERPPSGFVEATLCALLGYGITTDPDSRFDVAFKRKDATFCDPALVERIPVDTGRILNGRSLDISKAHVGRAFRDVFGYALDVDPTTYEGSVVEKSNRNAKHDGRVRIAPLPPESVRADCVYEKLIDNTSERPGLVQEYRVPVHGDEIPLAYRKYRAIEDRFGLVNVSAELVDPGGVFAPEERAKILRLARRMGIDYGEFDVLRDSDGRIYVVDANNTPWGPPRKLPEPEKKIALERMAKSFARLLARWAR